MVQTSFFSTSSNKTGKKNTKWKKKYLLLPLILALAVIPLIVHQFSFENYLYQYSWFINEKDSTDFFLGYKSILLTIMGFFLVFILLYQQFTNKVKKEFKIWKLFLIIYGLLAVLSTVMSDYSKASLNGSYEHFESIFVILTYCLLLYYAYQNVKDERDIIILIKCTAICALVIGLLGSLQAVGLDLFRSKLGKMLISDPNIWGNLDKLIFSFEKNRVYATLFNPNYVGVYASLIAPIAIGYIILSDSKKAKCVAGLIAFLLVACTFGAQSRTGLIVLFITVMIILILFRKKIVRNKKVTFISIGSIIILFFIVNSLQNNVYLDRLLSIFSSNKEVKMLQGIETTMDYIKIDYNDETLILTCEIDENGELSCIMKDENGINYEPKLDNETLTFTLTQDTFNGITVTPVYLDEEGTLGCQVVIDQKDWFFKSKTNEEGYKYMNDYGRFLDAQNAPYNSFLDNISSVFSGRGYIWSRTLPLLKDTILIGTGPDTFVYYFPQDDYAGLSNNGFQSQVITKPHNMYLQIAIQTGILSLIAFLGIYISYIIDCIKTYRKSKYIDINEKMGILIAIGTIGYMISGLINDSTITVAPIFWTLLGIGFACNRITREKRERINKIYGNENK